MIKKIREELEMLEGRMSKERENNRDNQKERRN